MEEAKSRDRCTARARGQGGLSLIESLVAVVMAGTVVLAIITLVLTLLVSATSHRQSVRTGIEATTIAETIERMEYEPCAGLGAYAAAFDQLDVPNYDAEPVAVRYLADRDAASASWNDSCTDDQGVQQVVVRVTASARTTNVEELEFIKRDARCPVGGAVEGTAC